MLIYGCTSVSFFFFSLFSDDGGFFWLCEKALCTEAALNAIQRKYPQVYKTNDRLLLKPETIGVGLRDFMISIKSKMLFLIRRPIS